MSICTSIRSLAAFARIALPLAISLSLFLTSEKNVPTALRLGNPSRESAGRDERFLLYGAFCLIAGLSSTEDRHVSDAFLFLSFFSFFFLLISLRRRANHSVPLTSRITTKLAERERTNNLIFARRKRSSSELITMAPLSTFQRARRVC